MIPVFLPHAGCPHRCVFCNQVSITGAVRQMVDPHEVRVHVLDFLKYKKESRTPVEIAFFGGNFLGLKCEAIKGLLAAAREFVEAGQVDGIRFSTRPDTIDHQLLNMLKDYPVSTVELGVQSMDDQVLALSRRGHTRTDTERAVTLLHAKGYDIGLQIMVGLPGDDSARSMETGRQIADLKPDFVRIYPTLVLAGSPLAGWYQAGTYRPLPLDAAVTRVKALYLLFKSHQITTIRMGLQASKDLDSGACILAGPYHPAFGQLVHSEIFLAAAVAGIKRSPPVGEPVAIHVHPANVSKMRGLKNSNVAKLSCAFNLKSIQVLPDPALGPDTIRIGGRSAFSIFEG